MASVIDTIITPQAFEIVRDRIGRILSEEFTQQYSLSANDDIKVNHWIERFLPFAENELSAIVVSLAEGTYSGQTVIQTDGTYRYYIDVYVNAKTGVNNPGDQRAVIKLHRVMGVARAILEDARYKTLGFTTPPGFIMNRHIESIQIRDPRQKDQPDMNSTAMGRLILSVKVPEITSYMQAVAGKVYQTTVKLADTEKGYLWVDGDSGVFDVSFDSSFE